MQTAKFLAKINLILTYVWVALAVPSLLWWNQSILWIILISVWANIASHFAAFLAARSEVSQYEGYNLTDKDKEWLIMTISQLLVTTKTMPTAKVPSGD